MCGIAAVFGRKWTPEQLVSMQVALRHRGPDADGLYIDPRDLCGLAHNRLSIIDLSEAGRQPMQSGDGRFQIVLNGEIYNYLELRSELEGEFSFKTQTDTEVLLAAYQKWGRKCLDRLIGMFAFIVWDEREKTGFAARDRFGVKPLNYHHRPDGTVLLASEIKALHAAGVERELNPRAWADYLSCGLSDHGDESFWRGISVLPPGHVLTWKGGNLKCSRWYDIAERTAGAFDDRPEATVREEYFELMKESVKLRFRADVPVGINLSGGVDSSALLGLVHGLEKEESSISAFTFITGDERYDELPWVREMISRTSHPLVVVQLFAKDVPDLAVEIQSCQDEPFGGLPTIAYAKIFEQAKSNGVTVLLDGNGMDEQWAGYDYYQKRAFGQTSTVQGMSEPPVRPGCLTPEFRLLAEKFQTPYIFSDELRNLQYRDVRYTKIPRAMRFNDRVSMRSSTELREPFLDHRLLELSFRQPPERKILNGTRKKMLRDIVKTMLPASVAEAPKRPLQTPQREWLRQELNDWASTCIEDACSRYGGVWLDKRAVRHEWQRFCRGESDNSFYVWQWISLSLTAGLLKANFEDKYAAVN